MSTTDTHATASCEHCGTHFIPTDDAPRFCCMGCSFVYQLVHEKGFSRFYEFAGDSVRAPVRASVFHLYDTDWLKALVLESETSATQGAAAAATLELAISGISCVGCVWMVEALFERQAGALRARVASNSGKIVLRWSPGECDVIEFAKQLHRFGYDLGEADSAESTENAEHQSLLTTLGICSALALNGMAFTLPGYLGMADDYFLAPLFVLLTALSATFSLLIGGSYFIRRAWQGILQRILHIDLPISLGIVSAYGGSLIGWMLNDSSLLYFDFVAIFICLMLGGRYLQLNAVERNRRRLQQRLPSQQQLLRFAAEESGERAQEPLVSGSVAAGDRFLVNPGQTIPVASQLFSDIALLSFESINGEPDPVSRAVGQRVPSGALNAGTQSISLRAEEDWDESLLAALQKSCARDVSRYPRLERILRVYMIIVLVAGFAGAIGWWVATGELASGLQVMISLFVVSCPCALGVALPLADELAASSLERFGIFVRRHHLWQRLGDVRKVIFDKTGTLTLENPVLINRGELDQLPEQAQKALAVLTSGSLHPISRTLTAELGAKGALGNDGFAIAVKDIPGKGLQADIGGDQWHLIKGEGGRTELRKNGNSLASFEFTEEFRQGTADQVIKLKARGFSLHVLSGDHAPRVKALARKIGIPEENALGGLAPADKAHCVRELDQKDTLYLGDGANDGLAFSEAWCTGVPVADRSVLGSKADFFLLGANLGALTTLFTACSKRAEIVRNVFTFSILYNIAAAAACLSGCMSPLIAAILMPLSSVVTIGFVTARTTLPHDDVLGKNRY